MRDEVLGWEQGATTCECHTTAVNSAVRDATHVLEGLLYQESYLLLEEPHTGTTGKSRARAVPVPAKQNGSDRRAPAVCSIAAHSRAGEKSSRTRKKGNGSG